MILVHLRYTLACQRIQTPIFSSNMDNFDVKLIHITLNVQKWLKFSKFCARACCAPYISTQVCFTPWSPEVNFAHINLASLFLSFLNSHYYIHVIISR